MQEEIQQQPAQEMTPGAEQYEAAQEQPMAA